MITGTFMYIQLMMNIFSFTDLLFMFCFANYMGSEIEDNRKKTMLPSTLKRKECDTHLPHPWLIVNRSPTIIF